MILSLTAAQLKRITDKTNRARKRLWIKTNMAFGLLKTVRVVSRNRWGYVWECICSCNAGKRTLVFAQDLKSGNTTSCGCISKINRQGMKKFYQQAICKQCSVKYIKNRHKKTRNLCPLCSHRLSAREWARRKRSQKR